MNGLTFVEYVKQCLVGDRTDGCGLGTEHNHRLNAAKLGCMLCRPRHLQQNPLPLCETAILFLVPLKELFH
jgi:hypothetical protein